MVELGELCSEVTVGFVGSMASEYCAVGVPFIRSLNVKPFRIEKADIKYVSPQFHAKISKSRLRAGDVVIVRTGVPGTTAVVPDWMDGGNCSDLVIARPSDRLDSGFLSYFMNAVAHHVGRMYAVGAVQQHFNVGSAKTLKIPLPPLPEQRAIAAVLGALDDKIEVNRKMARVLEAIARAVFTSWFVDFDPVRRRPLSGPTLALALPESLAALFPTRLVNSPLGEVPEGWRVVGLDADIKFLNGLALQKFPPKDGRSLPVIKIAQLRKGDTDGSDRASGDLHPEYIVQDGDVLFSWSGSLECVLWAGGPGALNQHLFKVTSATMPKWFYYLWVHHHLPDFRHIAAGKATTMGHIQRHHLTQALVTMPTDMRLMQAMDQYFAPLIESLIVRAVQNRTLAALRDTLLPKLISGELRIADAERIVGRAV